ncbi:T9SS type A sorting domain-containing protein [Rufibacter glacialis]|uniref:T9SS type A sorting domain-containing protein n=1 Tax=Rufibacter glacialis TaxID=1259555 RepID=A0ABV4RJQ9_9BACT|nr:T9SS type A sorting domain-containing protein [Rufibacter glacialis]GGK88488.1 hypothetical protein GCM10011405_40310 [Rufibacter glacialis]
MPTSTDATGTNTLVLESGQVQTIETLSTPGSAPYTAIQSSVKGSNATINFTSLGFCTDYLVVEDVHAQGPGNYYAGLNSDNKGNNNGWHFITCATSIYSPEGAADYDLPFSSVPAISDGSNKWQEIRFNGELVGAIKDGGNVLGEVTIDFLVSADSNRAAINTSGAEVGLMPRNWRVKATNQPSADKPVSIRLYGLQEEFEKYKNGIGTVAGLGDLQFTTYSNSDSTENCDFLDNTAEGAVTSLISNALFTTAGNYFTAELTGITDLTEFYLHNGGAAIDFIASKPAPTVQPQPEIVEEEMDFTAHWNAKTVKLKWKTTNDSQNTSYDVEAAPSADEKEFKTIISKAPRQNSSNAAVAVYHAEDFNPAPVPANYYRLKRLNQDGTVTYSQTIKVENKSFAAAVQAAPNPFTDKLKLTINAEKAGELSVKLMNEKGETALEKKVKVSKGTSTTDLVIGAKVKPGIYLLVTELNGERASQRLIKE